MKPKGDSIIYTLIKVPRIQIKAIIIAVHRKEKLYIML